MNKHNKPKVIVPKVTDSGARKMTTFSSLKHAFNKQLRDFKIECRHAWQNKDVKKLWEYTVHCVGFFGYTVISVALALFMWIAAFFLTIGKSKKQNDDQSTYMALLNFVFKIFEVIFMTFFQIFAGMMGADLAPASLGETINFTGWLASATYSLLPNASLS